MCGIIGMTGVDNVVSKLYPGLMGLQHRGQGSAGIVTFLRSFHEHKHTGLVKDVFEKKELDALVGSVGVGHVRYPTVGEKRDKDSQPFTTTMPFGVTMAFNGNVTNYTRLHADFSTDSECDLETILAVFVEGVQRKLGVAGAPKTISPDDVFEGVAHVMDIVEGSYSVVAYVPKVGMLAFRDRHGIKPLEYGSKELGGGRKSHCFTSETVATDLLGYACEGSVKAGEAIIIDNEGRMIRKQVREPKQHAPCIYEWIYFARPASIIEGVSVSGFRYKLGRMLATIASERGLLDGVDIVTDVPSTATRGAVGFGKCSGIDYYPILDRSMYVGRSFIESSDLERELTAMLKNSPDMGILKEMVARLGRKLRIWVIDDSIVRGRTNRIMNNYLRGTGLIGEIRAGLLAPRIEHPCVYGIDMSIRQKFVALGRTDEEIAQELGADRVLYMTLEGLKEVAAEYGMSSFCHACFSGEYPTGITKDDLLRIEHERLEVENGC